MIDLHPCLPPSWARGGHTQTILGHLLPSPSLEGAGERLEVALDDGDTLVCRHYPGTKNVSVYLFHGLTGCADSTYMQRTGLTLQRLGFGFYLVNHRGCGEGAGKAKKPYHSGSGEDLSKVIERGRERNPGHRHIAVGFSLSGNALLLLAAGARGTIPPDAAIAVNAPINLTSASFRLLKGLNRVYDTQFVWSLRRQVRGEVKVPLRSTLRDFDQLYTAMAAGFRDREDYYTTCSAKQHLEKIRIPTIMLTTEDDPFVPIDDYRTAKLSSSTHLHVEKVGGHLGYLTKDTGTGTKRWLDYALEKAFLRLAKEISNAPATA